MKIKKVLTVLLALCMSFGMIATGCSNGGDDNDSPVSDPNAGNNGQGKTETTYAVTVSDGSSVVYQGNDINAAWAAIGSSGDYVLTLEKGTYSVTEGSQLSYSGAANIKISGDTTTEYGADVIISGKGSDQSSSKTRCLMEIQGTGNLVLENVTFYSTYRFDSVTDRKAASNTQAEVLGFDSTGTVAAYNSSFKSHQDTVRTVSKSFFYHCYIEGDVDFMWCEASSKVALYEDCAIKVLGDEAAAGYIAAPKTNVASKIWKGLVVLNSTIEIEDGVDAYLFRNPWGTSSTIYNNAAFVNVTVTGTLNAALAKSSANGTSDQQYVGWKVDSTIGDAYASKDSTIGVLSDTTKANEYSGRKAILNRYYDVANAKFVKDSEANWDIASVISENGWTVADDTSSELLDGEAEVTVVTYTLNAETVDGVTGVGFALESGKSHWVGAANDTITIPVSGKCTVAVYGYYAGYGTIKAGDQGEAVYDFNNGTTGSTIEKDYVVYDTNATSVVITASTASYITKIVVTYDDSIEYVPVTAIAVTGDSDTHTVGVKLALTATITPSNATNSDVKWTSGDEEKATVDEYTGKVTFLKAGNVTITATARDGSGVTGTIACAPTEASWTVAEWYTTDNTLDAEDGMVNAGIFSFDSSQYKAMSAASTFTNLSGVSITTDKGLKLNGSGELNFSTTAAATTTFIIGNGGKTANELSVTSDGGETATLISSSDDTYPTYVYRLSGADSWKVARAGTSEQNPIVYVKVVYDTTLDWENDSASVSYYGSDKTTEATKVEGAKGYIAGTLKGALLYVDATSGKLAPNGTNNGAQFNNGTKIRVPVDAGSVVTVIAYSGNYYQSVTLAGTAMTEQTNTFTSTKSGYVEIAATGNTYLNAISVTNYNPAVDCTTAAAVVVEESSTDTPSDDNTQTGKATAKTYSFAGGTNGIVLADVEGWVMSTKDVIGCPASEAMTTKTLSNGAVLHYKGKSAGTLRFRSTHAADEELTEEIVSNATALNYNGGLAEGDLSEGVTLADVDRYVEISLDGAGTVTATIKFKGGKESDGITGGAFKAALVDGDGKLIGTVAEGAVIGDTSATLTGSVSAAGSVYLVFSRNGAKKSSGSGTGGMDVTKIEVTPAN